VILEFSRRKGGKREAAESESSTLKGGCGMIPAICLRGIEAIDPSSNRIVELGMEASLGRSSGKGMSMTVPAKSLSVSGLMRSTLVPGGYFSLNGGLSFQIKSRKDHHHIVMLDKPIREANKNKSGSCPVHHIGG
jgi:hypothetical protein